VSYALAIHTSSAELGLALRDLNSDQSPRSQTWELGRSLSTHFHQHLTEFMQPLSWQDLAWISVAKGPGSFTSTRIGVVTARTLAQQLQLPLFAISSLAAVAHSAMCLETASSLSSLFAVTMPAQRGKIFAALYQPAGDRTTLVAQLDDCVLTPELWHQKLAALAFSDPVIEASPEQQGRYVTSLLALALTQWSQGLRPHWSDALPFYGQHPVETPQT
jgi:tRNA threonylcarbamoyl adenosine modification protein YeaZ